MVGAFADTEEAAYYLLGYGEEGFDYAEGGRGYDLPGDSLPLGPDHRYEVQGLYAACTDICLVDLGREYMPYLFLVTADGGLEMVDILNGFRYGLFCPMPIPGTFGGEFVLTEDEYGQSTALITDDVGMEYDLALWAIQSRQLPFRGSWSGVLEEVTVDGGSYAVVGDMYFHDTGAMELSISEVDAVTASGRVWLTPLGVTEEGLICGYVYYPDSDMAPTAGTFAFLPGTETTELGIYETLDVTVLTGASPYGREGETITFYAPLTDGTEPDLFAGEWGDVNSGRCWMTVTPAGEDYDIEIGWGDSAAVTYVWTMTGTRSGADMVLSYTDCTALRMTWMDDGTQAREVLTSGGRGSLVLAEPGVLYWQDDSVDRSGECRFEPVD